MDGEVEIRKFQPEDQAAVKRLILAGLEGHWGTLDTTLNPDLDDIAASYAGATFLTAWQDSELVGTGALVRESDDVARIVRMSVHRNRRRQGVGQTILQQLVTRAREQGCRLIVLETTATWHDAIAFYTRNGFRATGASEGDIHFALVLTSD